MTDAEVVCSFMEAKPKLRKDGQPHVNAAWPLKWWHHRAMTSPFLFPVAISLTLLHEIEAKLADGQRKAYMAELTGFGDDCAWRLVHATAEQKLKALAAVLREGEGK